MPGSDDGEQQPMAPSAPSASTSDPLVKAVAELAQTVAGISARLATVEARPAPAPAAPMPPDFPYGLPGYGTAAPFLPGIIPTTAPPATTSLPLPIHQIQFPHSPSPIPSVALLSAGFSAAADTSAPAPSAGATFAAAPKRGAPCPNGVAGPFLSGASAGPSFGAGGHLTHGASAAYPQGAPHQAPFPSAAGTPPFFGAPDAPVHGAGPGWGAPRFYKLELSTYDGSEDPLNWLNRCEQFFRGQRTLNSDRVWLASYHLVGAAQTWYYALEQDEGMPGWERFKELCNLRFGPPVRINRLAELARLPFLSTVQEYSERFNALLCHARNLSPVQKAELFVGGLPEHIHVDVELREPHDLQTAMHLARASERRAEATLPTPAQRIARAP
ncbi:uncharacterized protein LOC133886488 [Phragmites australis]|uniref:uncharacterized protein LOC133886488 n=1 Tax=Phragmites australis TaxID=29695 RepID=UPI002D79A633|nr:uncharacterized protein LOC133886488 [Phragmites australis]